MQIRLQSRNTLTVLMVIFFTYLAYLIFFASNDGMPEIDVDLKEVISYAVLAAEMGGHAVKEVFNENKLNIHQKGMTKEGKAELLTSADLLSNYLILDILKRFPFLQTVSEEKDSSVTEKQADDYRTNTYSLWLEVRDILEKLPSRRTPISDVAVYVDPLDATQEFTEGLTQYVTVMVCIAVKDEPIFGVIYRPFDNETVFGLQGWGVMSSSGGRLTLKSESETKKLIVVSRSHAGTVETLAKKAFEGENYVVEPAGGSGYKSLRVLNGTAELYIHNTAIKKWDTCAGDAILRAAGGSMLDLEGTPLKYGYDQENPVHVHQHGLVAAVRNPYSYIKKIIPNL